MFVLIPETARKRSEKPEESQTSKESAGWQREACCSARQELFAQIATLPSYLPPSHLLLIVNIVKWNVQFRKAELGLLSARICSLRGFWIPQFLPGCICRFWPSISVQKMLPQRTFLSLHRGLLAVISLSHPVCVWQNKWEWWFVLCRAQEEWVKHHTSGYTKNILHFIAPEPGYFFSPWGMGLSA